MTPKQGLLFVVFTIGSVEFLLLLLGIVMWINGDKWLIFGKGKYKPAEDLLPPLPRPVPRRRPNISPAPPPRIYLQSRKSLRRERSPAEIMRDLSLPVMMNDTPTESGVPDRRKKKDFQIKTFKRTIKI